MVSLLWGVMINISVKQEMDYSWNLVPEFLGLTHWCSFGQKSQHLCVRKPIVLCIEVTLHGG
jgi:hypothetical protein